jgi:patatin-like phospholipase/acyl hydrolase
MVGAATATTESGIEEEPGGDDRRFQVLALDGGGVRGIFTAAILAGLEEDVGSPVVEHFDLVVGTSTGGIIALARSAPG